MEVDSENASITVFVHAGLNAFCQSTGTTLIPMRLVHHTTPLGLRLAHVLAVPSNRSFEKAGTSVAGKYTIMLSRRVIPAHLTRYIIKNTT